MKENNLEWTYGAWQWISRLPWIEIIIGLISGLTAAIIFEILINHFRKPNLTFDIDPGNGLGENNQFNDGQLRKWKFLNVSVHNRHRRLFLRWLDVSADNATAKLSFRHWDTDVEVVKIDNARWNTTKQPIEGERLDINTMLIRSRESIPIEESAGIAIAVKTDQNDNIFGFNNQSYLCHPDNPIPYNILWSHPDFEVGNERKYKLVVKVLADGHLYSKVFTLENPRRNYNSVRVVDLE